MDSQEVRDSAFESVDAEEYGTTSARKEEPSLDILEQQQAREQARLLQRFRELRQWQQQQQEQLMQQQQLQLEMLKGEQLRVQTLVAVQRGAHWGDGRVVRPEVGSKSPPMMTPPRRSALGSELVKTLMSAGMPPMPFVSHDSGLVASMGDTLDHPQGSLPLPILPASPARSVEDDRYTNPDLFSNPGSLGDDLQAVDDRLLASDAGSEVSSGFYLPPLPPDPTERQVKMGGSVSTHALLQQMLGQLGPQQRMMLLEQRQAAVQESASPTFSPVHQTHAMPLQHSLPTSLPPQAPPLSSVTTTVVPALPTSSVAGLSVSEAMFVPRSFMAGFDEVGLSSPLPQVPYQAQGHIAEVQKPQGQGQTQRPQGQGPVQKPQSQGQVQRPQGQGQAQRPAMGLQGPAAGLEGSFQGYQPQASSFPPDTVQRLLMSQLQNMTNNATSAVSRHPQPLPAAPPFLKQQQQQQVCQVLQHHPSYRHQQPQDDSEKLNGFCGSEQYQEEQEEEEEEEEEVLDTTVKAVVEDPEERPISTGLQSHKTFEQMLEEQMAEEAMRMEEERRVEEKERGPTSRPFLRKGQGIARFSKPPVQRPPAKRPIASAHKADYSRGVTGARSEPPTRVATASRTSGGVTTDTERSVSAQGRGSVPNKRVSGERKRVTTGRKQESTEDRPQPEKLALIKRRSEAGRRAQGVEGSQRPLQDTLEWNRQPSSSSSLYRAAVHEEPEEKDSIADDASFVAGVREREKKAPMEAAELEEFEALEDIADNMSLVSNSSVVRRLVTPNKHRQQAAVSDLKTIVEKKKSAQSIPFERNAAMRSLLTISGPVSETAEQRVEDADDTLTEGDSDTEASTVTTARHSNTHHTVLDRKPAERDTVKSAFSDNIFSQAQTLNGLDFSKQFSLFSHQDQPLSLMGGDDKGLMSSPQKSVTRKVATLQSRLNTANNTAALLQKLSAHAGFLSAGLCQGGQVESQPRAAACEEGEANSFNNSVLSSSVSRPEPLVIGGNTQGDISKLPSDKGVNRDDDSDDNSGSMLDEEEAEDKNDDDDHNKQSAVLEEDSAASKVDSCQQGQGSLSAAHNQETAGNGNNNNNNNNNNNKEEDDEGDWDDEDEWTSSAPKVLDAQTSCLPGSGVDGTPPTSKLMSRLFPKLKPQPSAAQQQQQQKLQQATAASVGEGIQSKVLREKLAELEAEIEKFRIENASLERLRRAREDGVNKLKEEIARFDQEKTDELRRLDEFKAQEIKKLKHERKLFETYQKQVRSMPDKRDREEIETLKRQLNDLQDEVKRKENRWTSTVTRLKSWICELEGENVELREEVKLMERRRLEWMSRSTKPGTSQPTVKSSNLRSSTPTSDVSATTTTTGYSVSGAAASNGFVDPHHHSSTSSCRPVNVISGAVTMTTTQVNGAAAAGKSGSGVRGHHSSSGGLGDSMPREEPATPSMIEEMSPATMLNNINTNNCSTDADGSFLCTPATKSSSCRPVLDRPKVDHGNGQFEETQYPDGKVERVYSNGSREVLFPNGTVKEISSDGQYFIVSFFNGDIKQVFPDQRVVYYYADSQITHTTYPDRLEVLHFPTQTEKHYPDGTTEIIFPNQTVKYLFPSGVEQNILSDGTIIRIDSNGEKVLELPNGQREIHTAHYKRREFPDGTVKTLFNDGRQETRYPSGRVRRKDKDGIVVMDQMC